MTFCYYYFELVLDGKPIDEVVVLAHWKSPTVEGGPSDRTDEGGCGAGQ